LQACAESFAKKAVADGVQVELVDLATYDPDGLSVRMRLCGCLTASTFFAFIFATCFVPSVLTRGAERDRHVRFHRGHV
jgi:hypothetical protein